MSIERFSASRAERLMTCTASSNLEVTIPGFVPPPKDAATAAAERGTELHKVLEKLGTLAPRELKGMTQALQYMSELRSQRRFKVLVEHSVIAKWLPSKPRTTVDWVLYLQDELHIVDYKMGEISVEPFMNKQLMFYAASVLELAPKAKGVTLHIIQPFAKPDPILREWFCSAEDLGEFMDEAIKADQIITSQQGLTFVPSDACTFCPANPHGRGSRGTPSCPAQLSVLYPEPALDVNDFLGD